MKVVLRPEPLPVPDALPSHLNDRLAAVKTDTPYYVHAIVINSYGDGAETTQFLIEDDRGKLEQMPAVMWKAVSGKIPSVWEMRHFDNGTVLLAPPILSAPDPYFVDRFNDGEPEQAALFAELKAALLQEDP